MPPTAKQPAEMSKPPAAVEVAPVRKSWLEVMSPVTARPPAKVEVPEPFTSRKPVVVLLPVTVKSPMTVELAVEMKEARVERPEAERVPVTAVFSLGKRNFVHLKINGNNHEWHQEEGYVYLVGYLPMLSGNHSSATSSGTKVLLQRLSDRDRYFLRMPAPGDYVGRFAAQNLALDRHALKDRLVVTACMRFLAGHPTRPVPS